MQRPNADKIDDDRAAWVSTAQAFGLSLEQAEEASRRLSALRPSVTWAEYRNRYLFGTLYLHPWPLLPLFILMYILYIPVHMFRIVMFPFSMRRLWLRYLNDPATWKHQETYPGPSVPSAEELQRIF